jgi:hypothetical protein
MVQVFLPSGASYHQPPYTDEEVRDLNRRVSNIVSFTRPGGQRAAAEETAGENAGSSGDGAHTSPGDPGVDPAPS